MTHQPKSEPPPESPSAVRYLPVLLVVTVIVLLGLPLVVISMPQAVRIPVVEDHDGDPAAAALFSHWSHDQFKCYVCHTSIFPMEKKGFTHFDMEDGKYCGACHDGNVAWHFDGDDTDCETCHVESGYGFSPEDDGEEAEEEEAEEEEAEEEESADEAEASEDEAAIDDTDGDDEETTTVEGEEEEAELPEGETP